MALLFCLMVAVADQEIFLMLLGDSVDCLDQRAEEGVGDVHHHHANGIADLGRQRLSVGVRPIPQLRHGLHHRFTGVRADHCAVVEYAGYRRHGDACATRDVTNGNHDRSPD